MLDAGVVDRFRVVVFPVITGGAPGKERIFDGYPTSPSSWSKAARSTVGSSCSSTFPLCSMGCLTSATDDRHGHPRAALTDDAPSRFWTRSASRTPSTGSSAASNTITTERRTSLDQRTLMAPARLIPLPDGPYAVTGSLEIADPEEA
jgi:hypothetical protein